MLHVISDLALDVAASKEDTTGAIPKSLARQLLEPEDWRRAKAALSTALDPQGNGSLVGWENPEFGQQGLVHTGWQSLPLRTSGICRVFLAELDRKGDGEVHPRDRLRG